MRTRRRALRQRSLGFGGLCVGENSSRPQSSRRCALARRQASLRRQSTRRHHLRNRYSDATESRPRSISADHRTSTPSAAVSVFSSPPISRFKASSAAPTAISTPPSTDCSGISSPTASAKTSSTIARSKTSPAPSPSSGTAAIRTCRPSAVRAPRSFSFARKASTEQQLTDLVTFVYSLPYRPNRYRLANGELTPRRSAARRFSSGRNTRNGKPIPEANQCATCHSGPKYTNQAAD